MNTHLENIQHSNDDTVRLALNYLWGIPKDTTKALDILNKSAESGNAEAQYWLGEIYFGECYFEEVIPRNPEKAIEYFKRASQQNEPAAIYALGCCYMKGNGIKKNLDIARELFERNECLEFYASSVASHYLDGEILPNSPEQSLSKGIELLKMASRKGNPYAKEKLGEYYYKGIGIEKNSKKAEDLFLEAMYIEDKENQTRPIVSHTFSYKLATRYENAECVDKNQQKAFELYLKSADDTPYSFSGAYLKVGEFYEKGVIVKKDYEMAVKFYKKAIERGGLCGIPEYNLALCYDKGLGVEHNSTKAKELLRISANQGCPLAQKLLHPFTYYIYRMFPFLLSNS